MQQKPNVTYYVMRLLLKSQPWVVLNCCVHQMLFSSKGCKRHKSLMRAEQEVPIQLANTLYYRQDRLHNTSKNSLITEKNLLNRK